MKATWRGYLRLGRMAVPLRLYSMTKMAEPSFTLLHEKDGAPVERPLRCLSEGVEISYSETVRAVRAGDGRYVALTDDELNREVVEPKVIAVRQFCESGAIPPVYFEKPYFMVAGRGGEYGYALLREVLGRLGFGALVRLALRGREHIGVILVQDDMLVLHQLRFAGELLSPGELQTPALPRAHPRDVELLESVARQFSGPVRMRDYRDDYVDRLGRIVERKIKGLPPPKEERPDYKTTPAERIGPALAEILKYPSLGDRGDDAR